MKRSQLSRSTPLKRGPGPKRTGRMKAVSDKRRKVNKARRELADDRLDEPCRLKTPVCTGWAEHFHELVGRAQGGSLVDGRNLVPACDRCNGWVEEYPSMARRLGLKCISWQSYEAPTGRVPMHDHPLAIGRDGVS